jgi:hypothetical protein
MGYAYQNMDPKAAALTAALALKVDKTTTVNTQPLSSNVALTLGDIPATATKTTVLPATQVLAELGAKSTTGPLATVGSPGGTETLATVPGMASKTYTEMGGTLPLVAAYVTAHSSCDCVAGVGTLTFTAKAYGTALNGTSITGTLLSAPGTMAGGLPPQISNPMPSNQQPATVTVHDAAFNGTSVVVAGLSSAKRYRLTGTVDTNATTTDWIKVLPNGSEAGCGGYATGGVGDVTFIPVAYMISSDTLSKAFEIDIARRRGGLTAIRGVSHTASNTGDSVAVITGGAFTADLASIELYLGTAARTGWYMIEELP